MPNKIDRMTKLLSPTLLSLVLLVCMVGITRIEPLFLETVQNKTFDIFQNLHPRDYQETAVRILDIDDESLSRLGQWPWPRTLLAQVVTKLTEMDVLVIAFDMVFSEPDRTSPTHLSQFIPNTSNAAIVQQIIQQMPDHDAIFAESIAKAQVVTGFSFTADQNEKSPDSKSGISFAGDSPKKFLPEFKGAVINLPNIEVNAKGNGSFNIVSEQDGIVRRVPLLFHYKEKLYPSLTAEVARVASGAHNYIVTVSGSSREVSFGEPTGIVSVKVGNHIIPTDAHGHVWFYPTKYTKERWIPAWKLLQNEIEPSTLKQKIVFIGTSATGLKDIRATPLNPVTAGAEINAQLLEQILLGEFLHRPDWAPGAELTYLILLGLILILLMPRVGALWCAIIGGGSVLAASSLSWYAFTKLGWLIDPVLPSAICLTLYVVASLINFLKTEREKREIRNAFSHYMSPALVKRLAQDPSRLKLGGEIKNITILFSDIRGFTTISEQFSAEELTQFINRFLTPMTHQILRQKGTIDKYIGDCIMAFWNAPLDDADHAQNACQAALNMRDYLVHWNQEFQAEREASGKSFVPVRIGIGINTGDCCVGNMGSEQRFDYSVLGDDVNLASRLEGLSKIYGVDIVIGENTYQHVSDLAVIELDLVRVKGKKRATQIYGLLRRADFRNLKSFMTLENSHKKMLQAYRERNWDAAMDYAQKCLALDTPETRLRTFYKLYQERIKENKQHPLDDGWDGVHNAASK
jgi:adenylate cyclase